MYNHYKYLLLHDFSMHIAKKDQLDMLQSHRPELFLAAVVLWGGCHIPQEATDSKGTLSSLLMQAAQAAVGSLASLFRSINLSSTPLAA